MLYGRTKVKAILFHINVFATTILTLLFESNADGVVQMKRGKLCHLSSLLKPVVE